LTRSLRAVAAWWLAACRVAALCLAAYLSTAFSVAGAATAVHTADARWPLSLATRVDMLEDKTARLSLDGVLADASAAVPVPPDSPRFVPATALQLQPGFTRSAYWLRLRVANDGRDEERLRLVLRSPRLQQVDFYWNIRGAEPAGWQHSRAGTAVRVSEQEPARREPLLPINLDPGQDAEVLVRVVSASSLQIQPWLYPADAWLDRETRDALKDGALIGGLLMMAAYSLVLWLLSRSAAMGWQGAGFAMLAMYEGSFRGLTRFYLWPESPVWASRAPGVLGGACVLVLMFYLHSLARRLRIQPSGLPWFIALAVTQGAVCLGMLIGDYYVFMQINLGVSLLIVCSLVVAGYLYVRREGGHQKLLLCAILFALLSVGLRNVGLQGALPPILAGMRNYATGFTTAVAALVALAVWAHQTSQQRQQIQDKMIDLLSRQHHRLRRAVARQTRALNTALAEAESNYRKQTRIMAFIGHDLRAPLATIVGYARLMRHDGPAIQAGRASHLDTIEREATYQLTLIDELLEHARGERDQLTLAPTVIDLAVLLDAVAQHAASFAAQQRNAFVFVPDPAGPRWVLLDGARLQQVLLHLLANAGTFARDGCISLRVGSHREGNGSDGGDEGRHGTGGDWRLSFEVTDTGTGVEAEDRARAADSFEQAQPADGAPASPGDSGGSTGSTGQGSLGLGLFIAQRIVRRMGGELSLQSTAGRGCHFRFELLAPEAEAPLPVGAAHPAEQVSTQPPPLQLAHAASSAPLAPSATSPGTHPGAHPTSDALERLRQLADAGQWSGIEDWLVQTSAAQPHCSGFFAAVREALAALDFEGIQRLATAAAAAPAATSASATPAA
jgi:signal transduction histidine kinase